MTDGRLRELHAQGRTQAQVSADTGLSRRAVRAAWVRLGLGRQPRGRKPGRVQTEAVMVRFSPDELAEVDAARGDRPRAEWVRERAMRGIVEGEPDDHDHPRDREWQDSR